MSRKAYGDVAPLRAQDKGCKRLQHILGVASDKPEHVDDALPVLLGFPEGDRPLQVRACTHVGAQECPLSLPPRAQFTKVWDEVP